MITTRPVHVSRTYMLTTLHLDIQQSACHIIHAHRHSFSEGVNLIEGCTIKGNCTVRDAHKRLWKILTDIQFFKARSLVTTSSYNASCTPSLQRKLGWPTTSPSALRSSEVETAYSFTLHLRRSSEMRSEINWLRLCEDYTPASLPHVL